MAAIKTLIETLFQSANKTSIEKNWLQSIIDKYNHPERFTKEKVQPAFFESFDKFLDIKKLSDVRKKNFRVIYRALQRFKLYKHITLNLDTITDITLQAFEKFLKKEHTFFNKLDNGTYECVDKYKYIYETLPETRPPQPRGQNTINDVFAKLRTFFIWCINNNLTTNNPFKNFKVQECIYGTPYYLTIKERNQLYNADLSHRPQLAIQRDIFVFQCVIGCRVSDLYRFTKDNVINDCIEYIPRKTKVR